MEIRGIWITTTASQVFNSQKNIAEAINFLAETGFNVVFPVVWNNGLTTYRSQVMRDNFGIEINPIFQGRDPLLELITEAKKVNIAVIPWFEYGFASSYQKNGGSIIAKKPEWAARDIAGNLLNKNGFDWLNSLDNEVQDFLLSLFLEVVKKYEIAGIQGDDRFPSLPVEGGYDQKTIARYQQEYNQQPPQNPKDPKWLQWRADILSSFLHRFYREIININPNLIISMSPNVYSWGYENYLQDSQTWVDLGLVDLIHPQLYQRQFEHYQRDIDRLRTTQFTSKQLPQLIPGILLKQGKYRVDPELLVKKINYNRFVGIQGEILFFYEGLREDNNALANLLKSTVYSQPAGIFDPKELKKNTFTHRRINNDYYYINPTLQQMRLKVKFDWVEPFSQGLAVVKMGHKCGYIDQSGKFITRLEYDTAAPFSEEMALVSIKNKYGYIDKTGKEIIPRKFDDGGSFSEGIAAVKIGNKWGYIDELGNMIISGQFDEVKPFSSDMAAVKIDNKWGYIDKSGSIVIPSYFDDGRNFDQGLAIVKVGNKWGYIDRTGQFIISPQFDDADVFAEGLANVKIGEKWGYINQYGELIIPANFDGAKPFSQGMGLVNVAGKWGYIRKP